MLTKLRLLWQLLRWKRGKTVDPQLILKMVLKSLSKIVDAKAANPAIDVWDTIKKVTDFLAPTYAAAGAVDGEPSDSELLAAEVVADLRSSAEAACAEGGS